MRVANTGGAERSGRSARGRAAASGDGAGFARALASVTADGAAEASACGGVAGVLAVQEVAAADGDGRRRRAAQRGEGLLDELERLRRAMLAGAVPAERLAALAGMLRARTEAADDPHLAAVLAEIELLAEVELAKHTMRHSAG